MRLKVMARIGSLLGTVCADPVRHRGCRPSLHRAVWRGTAGLLLLAVAVAGCSSTAAWGAAAPGGRRQPGVDA